MIVRVFKYIYIVIQEAATGYNHDRLSSRRWGIELKDGGRSESLGASRLRNEPRNS